MYADIAKDRSASDEETNEDLIRFTTEYEDYKRMFENDVTFGRQIKGRSKALYS